MENLTQFQSFNCYLYADKYTSCSSDSYSQLLILHLYLNISEAFQTQLAQNLTCHLLLSRSYPSDRFCHALSQPNQKQKPSLILPLFSCSTFKWFILRREYLGQKSFELVRVKLYRISFIYYITCWYLILSHSCPCTWIGGDILSNSLYNGHIVTDSISNQSWFMF